MWEKRTGVKRGRNGSRRKGYKEGMKWRGGRKKKVRERERES